MNTILVPVDFSDNSRNALKYAVEVAKMIHAKVCIFHSYFVTVSPGIFAPVAEYTEEALSRQETRSELKLIEWFNEFKNEHYTLTNEPLKCEVINREGPFISCLQKVIKEYSFDFIVMGTKGASGLAEVLFGSNTVDVISEVKIPVFVVPEGAAFRKIKNIVYATNFNLDEVKTIDGLIKFSNYFNAEVNCLHINTDSYNKIREEKRMHTLQQKYLFTPLAFTLKEGDSVSKTIEKTVEEMEADVLAILPEDKSFIESLFTNSLTRKMGYHTKTPLLVLRKK